MVNDEYVPAREAALSSYRPTFLAQVHDGNVAAISAKGATVEGSFKRSVRYPDAQATATTMRGNSALPKVRPSRS